MKFIAFSDSHSNHKSIPKEWFVPADVIIFAGDLSSVGYKHEAENFLLWLESLDYKHKIIVAGNHDFCFDEKWQASTPQGLIRWSKHACSPTVKINVKKFLTKYPFITYLNDSGIQIKGIKIWGSPVTPWFHDWAFNRDRGPNIQKHWDMIPNDTDILITHGPPYGVHDKTIGGDITGCKNLSWEITNRIKPKYHICGHIHEAYGIQKCGDITFINASTLDENYEIKNKPIIFEI